MKIFTKHIAAAGSALIALAVIAPSFASAHPHFDNTGPYFLYQEQGKPKLSRYYETRPGRYTRLSDVPHITYTPAVRVRQPVVPTTPLTRVQPVRRLERAQRSARIDYNIRPALQRPETCVHTVNRKGSTRRFSDSYDKLRGHVHYDYSPRQFELNTSGYGHSTYDAISSGQRWVRSYRGF